MLHQWRSVAGALSLLALPSCDGSHTKAGTRAANAIDPQNGRPAAGEVVVRGDSPSSKKAERDASYERIIKEMRSISIPSFEEGAGQAERGDKQLTPDQAEILQKLDRLNREMESHSKKLRGINEQATRLSREADTLLEKARARADRIDRDR